MYLKMVFYFLEKLSENISFGKSFIESEIIDKTEITEEINQFPDKYDTLIGEEEFNYPVDKDKDCLLQKHFYKSFYLYF